jgi:hypothetical protein
VPWLLRCCRPFATCLALPYRWIRLLIRLLRCTEALRLTSGKTALADVPAFLNAWLLNRVGLHGLLAGTVVASIGEVPLFVELLVVPFGLCRESCLLTGHPDRVTTRDCLAISEGSLYAAKVVQ